ncbi:MAG TPA: GNAT family N-acetyltransferase [Streptosporangiaceae bacterium]|nr:GNAT family N-acetyltransferase [Streptosporangiaceae bacterium]
MIFRPVEPSGLSRLRPLLAPDPASALSARQFEARLESGEYRAAWTWIAEESPGAMPAAAAIWWGTAREELPAALDGLFARPDPSGSGRDTGGAVRAGSRTALAADLLTAAHEAFAEAGLARPPDFHILLPPDWRDRPDVTASLDWRLEAARRAGLTSILERVRFEWTPEAGVPEPAGRLRFRPEPDDEVFIGLFSGVLAGTLDATSRNIAAHFGARTQASRDVAFYRDHMLGQRSWWRVAETLDGDVAGFGVPSRNTDVPVVGYLGVVPEHRGHGYAGEILAEITRILVAEAGAAVIEADTDLENRPMAAAFERAGYRSAGRRLVLAAG